jgi:hypothetical protein
MMLARRGMAVGAVFEKTNDCAFVENSSSNAGNINARQRQLN